MSRVAYIRVSSVGQNVDRQLPDEKFDKTFTDKASAKDTDRPALAALLDYVRDGDKVVIHSIDRLARNLADLEQLVDQLNSNCLLYTSPSPRDQRGSRMPSSA